jgi:hypothetical protein
MEPVSKVAFVSRYSCLDGLTVSVGRCLCAESRIAAGISGLFARTGQFEHFRVFTHPSRALFVGKQPDNIGQKPQ